MFRHNNDTKIFALPTSGKEKFDEIDKFDQFYKFYHSKIGGLCKGDPVCQFYLSKLSNHNLSQFDTIW